MSPKRALCLLAACVLCVVFAFSVLAEGHLSALWKAGCQLLTNTNNVFRRCNSHLHNPELAGKSGNY